VILGLPFLLFFPGYILVAALFTKKEPMNNVEMAALSCGISIAVTALIGFGLNYTSWGIRLEPVLYSLTAFIFVVSAIAIIRRIMILKGNKLTAELALSLPSWEGHALNNSLSIILVVTVLGAFGILGYTIAAPKIGERFTEFYILGNNGKADDYPIEFILNNGQITMVTYGDGTVDTTSGFGKVTLGIVNEEHQTAVYSIKLTINGEPANIGFGGTTTQILGPIELQPGEQWENEIGITPDQTGDSQKVELLLFNGAETTAEDSVHFWIDVKTSG
jgi:uncharacterized membrane protein